MKPLSRSFCIQSGRASAAIANGLQKSILPGGLRAPLHDAQRNEIDGEGLTENVLPRLNRLHGNLLTERYGVERFVFR
jgi:hypothetical protein